LISKAIITPGPAPGTDVGACGTALRDQPERENEQPRPGLTNHVRWVSAARTPAPDVPPAARDRLAATLIPLFASSAAVWTTGITQLPRDQAIELLAWMAQALTAATPPTGNTPKR